MRTFNGYHFAGIIPARYASSRFPGKPLVTIGDKPMIQRVYEQASKSLDIVYIATMIQGFLMQYRISAGERL